MREMKNGLSLKMIVCTFLGLLLSHPPAFSNVTPLPASYTELLPFVIPAPDQKRAGSCLFMASTGAMEILYNKSKGPSSPQPNGDTDLSEVYALKGRSSVADKSWFEDPILRFNSGGVLSKDVPFNPETFWNSVLGDAPRIPMPEIATKRIFVASRVWAQSPRKRFGVMNEETIDKVKRALVEYKSPVVFIYRDAGYEKDYGKWDTWHVVVIVGYDDNKEEGGPETCWTVRRSLKGPFSFPKNKLKTLLKKGCREKGVFYVRDSEGDKDGDGRVPPYVLRSYDWLKYLGNHAFVAYLKDGSAPSSDDSHEPVIDSDLETDSGVEDH